MRRYRSSKSRLTPFGVGACLGSALLATAPVTFGQTAGETGNAARLEKLEKENQELKRRLDAMEGVSGPAASPAPSYVLKTLTHSTLSGFVSSSYFYDTSTPPDNSPNGYLWNRHHNSFTLNKLKLTLASPPAEQNGDHFSIGYRASLIFGEDSPIVDTGLGASGFGNIREAYIDMNVPIGTGLNVKAGQLISLLNYESGDGGAANANFSQGNQWYFTGNGPGAGVQVGYTINDKIDVKARVQNGLYTGAVDNNGFKTFMGSVGIKPDNKTSISLIGFGGREGAAANEWLKGASIIASREICETMHVNFATELDYFNLDVPGGSADWWSVGGWLSTEFTPTLGLALRGDYMKDSDGAGTSSPSGGFLGFPINTGMDSLSATLTLNYRPLPNIKIQPEIRYDHTSLAGGFDGRRHRFILGAGVSYLF